jgi:hypothetical protein
MSDRVNRCNLAPPKDVVLNAKAVMGAIDLDPYSTADINRLVLAARYYDRDQQELADILRKDWQASGEKRVLVAPPVGAAATRLLINKTLREYRRGGINQAILWLSHNESIIKAPWLWDFPVCIPFRRLRPVWWDDEVETFRGVSPSDWSAIVYLPPPENPAEFQTKLSRFCNVFSAMGRVVFNQFSGEGDWEESYKAIMKKPYNYRD